MKINLSAHNTPYCVSDAPYDANIANLRTNNNNGNVIIPKYFHNYQTFVQIATFLFAYCFYARLLRIFTIEIRSSFIVASLIIVSPAVFVSN